MEPQDPRFEQTPSDHRNRFVASPPSDVKTRLVKESDALKKDMENLEKKLHYLETTYKNSREHLEAVFKNGGR